VFLAQTLQQQHGDLQLTRREPVERRVVPANPVQRQVLRNAAGEITLAGRDIAHCAQEFSGIASLAHVARGASFDQPFR